jgi:hypothetical protein
MSPSNNAVAILALIFLILVAIYAVVVVGLILLGRINVPKHAAIFKIVQRLRLLRYKLPLRHPITVSILVILGSGTGIIVFHAVASSLDIIFGRGTITQNLCDGMMKVSASFVAVAIFALYSFLFERVCAAIPNKVLPAAILWVGRARFVFLLLLIPVAITTTSSIIWIDIGPRAGHDIYLVQVCVVDPEPIVVSIFAVLDFVLAVVYCLIFYSNLRKISSLRGKQGDVHMLKTAQRNLLTSAIILACSLSMDILMLLLHFVRDSHEVKHTWLICAAPLLATISFSTLLCTPSAWDWNGWSSRDANNDTTGKSQGKVATTELESV